MREGSDSSHSRNIGSLNNHCQSVGLLEVLGRVSNDNDSTFHPRSLVNISPSRTWIVNKDSILKNVASGAVSSYTYQWEHADELYPRISQRQA